MLRVWKFVLFGFCMVCLAWSDGRYPELTLAFLFSVNEYLLIYFLYFTLSALFELSVGGYNHEKV